MNRMFKVLGLVSLVSLFAAPAAFAAGSVSLYGAGVLPQTVDISGGQITGKFGYGGGLLGELYANPHLGFEVGAAYLHRQFGGTAGGVDLGITVGINSVYVPAGIRIHANRIVSLEAGGFYDQVVDTGGGSNYGVQGGLRISVPMGATSSLFFEGRYDLGLKSQDLSSPGGSSSVKQSDLVVGLVGLTFGGFH